MEDGDGEDLEQPESEEGDSDNDDNGGIGVRKHREGLEGGSHGMTLIMMLKNLYYSLQACKHTEILHSSEVPTLQWWQSISHVIHKSIKPERVRSIPQVMPTHFHMTG